MISPKKQYSICDEAILYVNIIRCWNYLIYEPPSFGPLIIFLLVV